MGVVFEAYDLERKEVVALKQLRSLDPTDLLRFKREFRTLRGLNHRNLVQYRELFGRDGHWFFTMELVDGPGFWQTVRPNDSHADGPDTEGGAAAPGGRESDPSAMTEEGDAVLPPEGSPSEEALKNEWLVTNLSGAGFAGADEVVLRDTIRQLAEGIAYLHSTGRLHRDIKPPNVLIEEDTGRVVLLDFGLSIGDDDQDAFITRPSQVVGTWAYMSPEQAAGAPLGPAADWYAFGVMLYETLVGALPFQPKGRKVLWVKQVIDPTPLVQLDKTVPKDLSDLCMACLSRSPQERPTGTEILRALGSVFGGNPTLAARPTHAGLVGREEEQLKLHAALADSLASCLAMHIVGPAGIGKTALAGEFLRDVSTHESALVLRSRCYEHEGRTYKVLSGLLRDLTHHLESVPDEVLESCLPPSMDGLQRVFPELLPLRVQTESSEDEVKPSAMALRQQTIRSLRFIFERLAERSPVVLLIDDLQWADVDSIAILRGVLRPPNAPKILVVVTHRAEHHSPATVRRMATSGHSVYDLGCDQSYIELAPLDPASGERLLAMRVGREIPQAKALRIVLSTEGNAWALEEYARHLAGQAPASATTRMPKLESLDELLESRLQSLSQRAREVLQATIICGTPVHATLVADALSMDEDTVQLAITSLESQRLVTKSAKVGTTYLEPTHDRIRTAVRSHLSAAEVTRFHELFVDAIKAQPEPDLDALLTHLIGAERHREATLVAIQVADEARAALALDRAQHLYHLALRDPSAPHRTSLKERLGTVLADMGRGAEAAPFLLEAAEKLSPKDEARASAMRREAAMLLLHAGRIDEGLRALTTVMNRAGLSLPDSRARKMTGILYHQWMTLTRPEPTLQGPRENLSASQVEKLDALWTASLGLGMADPVSAMALQPTHLDLARKSGDSERWARAMVNDAAILAVGPARARRLARQRIEQTLAHATDVSTHAMARTLRAFLFYQDGQFADALSESQQMLAYLEQKLAGDQWSMANAQLYQCWSLFYLGRIDDMCIRVSRFQLQADERGDHYGAFTLRSGLPGTCLVLLDRPTDALRALSEATDKWTKQDFHLEHFWALYTECSIDLYNGNGVQAYMRLEQAWPRLRGSGLLQVAIIDFEARELRARAALAAFHQGHAPKAMLRRAERDANRIARKDAAWMRAPSALLKANVAWARGKEKSCIALLQQARADLEKAGMHIFGWPADYVFAQITGDTALQEDTKACMLDHGFSVPARCLRLLAPFNLPTDD